MAVEARLKQRVAALGTQDGPERGPGGPGGPGQGGGDNTQHRAEGGVIYPVQHMEAGGMIATPYANPMKEQMGSPTMGQPRFYAKPYDASGAGGIHP